MNTLMVILIVLVYFVIGGGISYPLCVIVSKKFGVGAGLIELYGNIFVWPIYLIINVIIVIFYLLSKYHKWINSKIGF
jgi:hypothetical protein